MTEGGDTLRFAAPALCLEEMLCCDIPEGALYYGEIRHRMVVSFTPQLRDQVRVMFEEMHALYQRGYTPKGQTKPCMQCLLSEGFMSARPDAHTPGSGLCQRKPGGYRMKHLLNTLFITSEDIYLVAGWRKCGG